jgi:hypothetical protein
MSIPIASAVAAVTRARISCRMATSTASAMAVNGLRWASGCTAPTAGVATAAGQHLSSKLRPRAAASSTSGNVQRRAERWSFHGEMAQRIALEASPDLAPTRHDRSSKSAAEPDRKQPRGVRPSLGASKNCTPPDSQGKQDDLNPFCSNPHKLALSAQAHYHPRPVPARAAALRLRRTHAFSCAARAAFPWPRRI